MSDVPAFINTHKALVPAHTHETRQASPLDSGIAALQDHAISPTHYCAMVPSKRGRL